MLRESVDILVSDLQTAVADAAEEVNRIRSVN
jgi:hypothetical protein